MARRLHNWLWFNVMFALLPLSLSLLLRFLTGNLTMRALADSPEILFFALIVSATAFGDLNEISGTIGRPSPVRHSGTFLLLAAIVSAVLYGSLLFDIVGGSGLVDFRLRLLWVSIGLAVVCLIVGTAVEVWISRIEDAA